MLFNSLDSILKQIVRQPEWKNYQEYCQVTECWQQIINRKILENTKPISWERNIFYLATSSAVWSQELALQRYSLLKKLNNRLDFTIKDLRFSPAKWHESVKPEINKLNFQAAKLKQLKIENKKNITKTKESQTTPHDAIKNWLQNINDNSSNLVPCPQCQALTPQRELTRWQICRYCIAQKWDREYRPPYN